MDGFHGGWWRWEDVFSPNVVLPSRPEGEKEKSVEMVKMKILNGTDVSITWRNDCVAN